MKNLLEALSPGSEDLALARAIDPSRIPAHIAIIMDGNGRWARQRKLPRVAGHKEGVPAVRTTVETCAQLGVGALTLYAFSVENWKRPRLEVDTLWRLSRCDVVLDEDRQVGHRRDVNRFAFRPDSDRKSLRFIEIHGNRPPSEPVSDILLNSVPVKVARSSVGSSWGYNYRLVNRYPALRQRLK